MDSNLPHTEPQTLPISVSRLEKWIPHRPPMVWVDEVISVGVLEGECNVRLKPEALYMGPEGIRQSSFIEWVAQSFGYVRAAQYLLGLLPGAAIPEKVFLVGIRDAQFMTLPKCKDELSGVPPSLLRIQVSGIRQMGPLTLFDGRVLTQEGEELFHCKLKVYSA